MTRPIIFDVNVIVTSKNDLPAIELRRNTTNPEIIRAVIRHATHETPLLILPKFSNKMQTLNNLQEKGILSWDKESRRFVFNI